MSYKAGSGRGSVYNLIKTRFNSFMQGLGMYSVCIQHLECGTI